METLLVLEASLFDKLGDIVSGFETFLMVPLDGTSVGARVLHSTEMKMIGDDKP